MEQKFNTVYQRLYLAPTDLFEIHINNDGRWPAVLKRIKWGFCDRKNIPPAPEYTEDVSFLDTIRPGVRSHKTKVIQIPLAIPEPAIFVRFEFFDVFLQKDRTAGFIVEMMPGKVDPMPVPAPEGYTNAT
jgi:hypothetical protein